MSTHDRNGREWAKVSDIKEGSIISTDSNMGCVPMGTRLKVEYDGPRDWLYFNCAGERHYLGGHLNDEGTHYVGIYHEQETVSC